MTDDSDDLRSQLAAAATQRIVGQCRAHVERVTGRLEYRLLNASVSSPMAADLADKQHAFAFEQRLRYAETASNALLSHLLGLQTLLDHETFYPLPCVPIVRSIAELCASFAWVMDAAVDRDTRNARSYATLFRSIESYIPRMRGEALEQARDTRKKLVSEIDRVGGTAHVRVKDGVTYEEVVKVTIGRGHATTSVNYTQRITAEISGISRLYASMSGITHGEPLHVTSTWLTPGLSARLIGVVAMRSVEAWSVAAHTWVGAQAATFINAEDWRNLLRSVPPELISEFATTDRFSS